MGGPGSGRKKKADRIYARPRDEVLGENKDLPLGEEPKKKRKPVWRVSASEPRLLESDKIGRRSVDVDVMFQRSLQMVEFLLDRMENEIDHCEGFQGVPDSFPQHLRELSASMNALSMAHARWLKANEEMYEQLSDAEKLKALQTWVVAQYPKNSTYISEWLQETARLCRLSLGKPTPLGSRGDLKEVTGGIPNAPNWIEVANKVRAEFAAKRQKKFGRPIPPHLQKVLDAEAKKNPDDGDDSDN